MTCGIWVKIYRGIARFPCDSTDFVLMCLATLAQYASVTNRQAELLYQYV